MSVKIPDLKRSMEDINNNILSIIVVFLNRYPVINPAKAAMAINDVITVKIIVVVFPISKIPGEYTNRNGIIYSIEPYFKALNPVLIGGDPAMDAPAYAATQTGGVIFDA